MAWVLYLGLAIVGIVWLGLARGELSLKIFLDPEGLGIDVVLGIGSGAFLVAGWRFLRRFLKSMRELENVMRPWCLSLDNSEIFGLALLSGFSEELFFRGALQSSLGWFLATLIFAALHTGPGRVFLVWTIFAFFAGSLFAALAHYRGSIFSPFLAHFLVNWINLHALASNATTSSD